MTPTPTPCRRRPLSRRRPRRRPRARTSASILIAKVDNKGTADPDDDVALDGATFEVRLDDGDGIFETDQDVLAFGPADAPGGMLDTDLLDEGKYWIVETAFRPGSTAATRSWSSSTPTPRRPACGTPPA